MSQITGQQCGDLLAIWLGKTCSPENAKVVASEVGYNESPFFGAKNKKIKLVGELVMANVALAIFAVNQVFDQSDAKLIIDSFLSISNKSMFGAIKRQDNEFDRKYERRMGEYFQILHQDKPGITLSFAFMKNLDLNPLKNMQGQLLTAARFGDSLTKTIDVLKRMELR